MDTQTIESSNADAVVSFAVTSTYSVSNFVVDSVRSAAVAARSAVSDTVDAVTDKVTAGVDLFVEGVFAFALPAGTFPANLTLIPLPLAASPLAAQAIAGQVIADKACADMNYHIGGTLNGGLGSNWQTGETKEAGKPAHFGSDGYEGRVPSPRL